MNTKRSLLTSCTALLLCFAMLLGTTFAWFTDSVTSSGNKIQSGTLKLDLHVLKEGNNNEWYSIKNESAPLFTYENWEPGYTDVTILKVENKGNLALKWVAKFFSENALSELAKVIDVYVLPGATAYPTDRSNLEAEGWTKTGTLDAFINSISTTTYGYLDGGESATLGIALQMQESAGNEYQNMTLGEFDIRIVATQLTKEEDSFGPDYDENAEYPADPLYFSQGVEIADSDILYGALNSNVEIGNNSSDVSATLPEGVKLADGVKKVKLTVKSADNNGNLALGDGESALNFDVHIDGIAADNQQPMIVNLGAILEAGLADTELKLFHVENGVPVAMTRVYSNFTAHNQYTYNEATGEVSIYVKSFSVFSAVNSAVSEWTEGTVADTSWYVGHESDDKYTLADVADFLGFRDLVDGGNTFEGKTVTLGVDIDLNNHLFDPIGYGYVHNGGQAFMGTFDGANHTVYGLYQQGWDLEAETGKDYTYSTAGAGLFASIKDATIKNLAVSGADIRMECVDMGIVVGYAQGSCTFDNIVVTNSKIANYQRYTGGVVGEVSGDPANSSVVGNHKFTNITVDSSVKVSSLWGDFDNACGGVIGGKWGDAKVLMENVTVAAEIDAFSDVTAAYQWYAYRRCGMLIGHTEQNSPKSALNADAPFLTCDNVNVYYGDWVNYTYYQFADQTDADDNRLWYSNYPWVRAQAGEYNGALSNVRYGNPIIKGEKINTIDLAEANNTGKVTITFNQLYGGGQGVYGKADHDGVTVHNSLDKTIYIDNNLGWTNLKLDYWFENDGDRWSTIVEGANITAQQGTIYKVSLPAYAAGFKITADGGKATTEALVSDLTANHTYPLTAFYLSLKVDGKTLDVNAGDWLYNTAITTNTAANYDVVIYDKNFTGSFTTNGYGVAIVLDANGKITKLYDAANSDNSVVLYEGAKKTTIYNASNSDTSNKKYATYAWDRLAAGETLVIFPNDGLGNYERDWARSFIESLKNNITMTSSTGIHTCENVCDTCHKCQDWTCYNCKDYSCKCLEITVNGNKFTATEGKWAYNSTNITSSTAANYQMIVFDKNYQGTFTTNNYGVAIVIDANGVITKKYDAATNAGDATYAIKAFAALKDGETLVIFPNITGSLSSDPNRQFGKNQTAVGNSATLFATAGFTKTIYFQNNWQWSNIKAYYWYAPEYMWHLEIAYPGVSATYVTFDGEYDIYRIDVPYYATGLVINGKDTNKGDLKTEDITISSIESGKICSVSDNANPNDNLVNAYWYGDSIDYTVIYFKPNSNWKQASARFSAYCWYYTGSTKNEKWFSMTDKDGDGAYTCWIPTKYVNIIFCRMNPSSSTNSWDYKWNQTGDLTVPTNGNNLFTLGSSSWDGATTTWSRK